MREKKLYNALARNLCGKAVCSLTSEVSGNYVSFLSFNFDNTNVFF